MKINLLFLFTVLTTACGVFLGENPRSFVYKTESGEVVRFSLSENRLPFTERRTLIAKAGNYSLKGKACEDSELKKFSNQVWSEIVKSDELVNVKSATIMLEKENIQGTPKYCDFSFSKKDNGEWIQN